MIRLIHLSAAALFLCALFIAPRAQACSTEAATVAGSAMNAVAYAETVIRWHQIRKVGPATPDNTLIHGKHAQATGLLSSARALFDEGDYDGALKHAYRIPEVLHY
jgi:hypothetical protein